MGLGHDGLRRLAIKGSVNLDALASDDLLMFLNKRGDKLKVVGAQGRVLAYLKMPGGQRIMREALQYIPATFGHSSFDYSSACSKVLHERLRIRDGAPL